MFPSLALGREFRAGNWTPERSQIGSEANANGLRLQLVGTSVALRRPTGQQAWHCGLQRPPEFGFPPFAAATEGSLEDPLACPLGGPGNEPLADAVSHRPELLNLSLSLFAMANL